MTIDPCPLCGSEAELLSGMGEFWVVCKNEACLTSGPCRSKLDSAISAWNTRHPIVPVLVTENMTPAFNYGYLHGQLGMLDQCIKKLEELEVKYTYAEDLPTQVQATVLDAFAIVRKNLKTLEPEE